MAKEISSVIKTQASKQYRLLLQEADKTVEKYSSIVSRASGMSKEEIAAEIQAIYLDNLRKADDPVALLKENLVNLMLKKQTSDFLKEKIYSKALAMAEANQDTEKIQEVEAEMIQDLMISDFDLKVHKTIQESVKAVQASEPRKANSKRADYDDNMVFEVKEVK